MKKFIYFTLLGTIVLFFTGCEVGYVATEPTYTETIRPVQPSVSHVWIDGNWEYNHNTRVYAHQNGYWEKPKRNRTYVSGRWQSTPRGHSWTRGHYEKH